MLSQRETLAFSSIFEFIFLEKHFKLISLERKIIKWVFEKNRKEKKERKSFGLNLKVDGGNFSKEKDQTMFCN